MLKLTILPFTCIPIYLHIQ